MSRTKRQMLDQYYQTTPKNFRKQPGYGKKVREYSPSVVKNSGLDGWSRRELQDLFNARWVEDNLLTKEEYFKRFPKNPKNKGDNNESK